jgi:hypothetical protein
MDYKCGMQFLIVGASMIMAAFLSFAKEIRKKDDKDIYQILFVHLFGWNREEKYMHVYGRDTQGSQADIISV